MHWIFWQAARKRRLRSLERAKEQALDDLDKAEEDYRRCCKQLGYANAMGTKRIVLPRVSHARQEVRLAGLRALEALDELNEARRDQ